MALLYIQRLANTNPGFFTTLSSRELFLVATVSVYVCVCVCDIIMSVRILQPYTVRHWLVEIANLVYEECAPTCNVVGL